MEAEEELDFRGIIMYTYNLYFIHIIYIPLNMCRAHIYYASSLLFSLLCTGDLPVEDENRMKQELKDTIMSNKIERENLKHVKVGCYNNYIIYCLYITL
jgi:hypothetical protein